MKIFNSLAKTRVEINIISIMVCFPYIFIMIVGIKILNIAPFLLFIKVLYERVLPYLH